MTDAPAVFPGPRRGRLAVTDQAAGGRIRIVDVGGSFDAEPRLETSWEPRDAEGWGRPTDVRLERHVRWGDVVVATDSFGAVVVAGLDGAIRWSADLGRTANPHAAALVPDGALVVAASTGGRISTFDTVGGGGWEDLELPGAHGVVWDATRGSLWALGDRELLELRPARVTAASRRWEVASVAPLPTTGGHDLGTADGSALWVTTDAGVHRFDRANRTWAEPPDAVDLPRVKSLDEDPDFRAIVLTRPEPGRDPEWVTSVVELPLVPRSIEVGGDLYKVRHWRRR